MSTNHPKGQIISKPPPPPGRGAVLRKPTSRLVVCDSVYHQPVDGQPVSATPKFTRRLESDEQPYGPRRLKIGPDLVALDAGWIERASLVLVENLEGTRLQVIPTPEEKAATAARIVEVWDVDGKEPLFLIRPGESFHGSPGRLSRVRLRCASESARIVYTVFPD